MPDFLCVKYQKKNIKLNLENLLNMRRKKTKEEKTKLFIQYEKLKKLNNFHYINSQ